MNDRHGLTKLATWKETNEKRNNSVDNRVFSNFCSPDSNSSLSRTNREVLRIMTKQERAKRALAFFISVVDEIPIYAAEDIIDEAQLICNQIRFFNENPSGYTTIEEVIDDYLGLGDRFTWIFLDSTPCETCKEANCSTCKLPKG